MVESWYGIVKAFPAATSKILSLDWAKAWTGKGAAQAMKYDPNLTFGQLLSMTPQVEIIGGREYNVSELASAFSSIVDGPYDMNFILKMIKGPSISYQQNRWQLQIEDTYLSITQRLNDTLVRKYVLGENGRLVFVSSYVIGV